MNVLNFLTKTVAPLFGPIGQAVSMAAGNKPENPGVVGVIGGYINGAEGIFHEIIVIVQTFEKLGSDGANQAEDVKLLVHELYQMFPSLNGHLQETVVDDVIHVLYELRSVAAKHQAVALARVTDATVPLPAPVTVKPVQRQVIESHAPLAPAPVTVKPVPVVVPPVAIVDEAVPVPLPTVKDDAKASFEAPEVPSVAVDLPPIDPTGMDGDRGF